MTLALGTARLAIAQDRGIDGQLGGRDRRLTSGHRHGGAVLARRTGLARFALLPRRPGLACWLSVTRSCALARGLTVATAFAAPLSRTTGGLGIAPGADGW